MKVDLLGFLLSQHELLSHDVHAERPRPALDIVHATVAPPSCIQTAKIEQEASWFRPHAHNRGPHVVFGIQHPPLDAAREDLYFLRSRGGIVFSTIAYDRANRFGGGFTEPAFHLTDAGRTFLDAMAHARMVLDLSHAGHRTANDALDHVSKRGSRLPVIATHTGCHAVYDHPRNLPDDALVRICAMGGIVGIHTMTFGLDPEDKSLEPFVRHVRYAVELLGEDCVAIGSGGVYRTMDPAAQQELFDPPELNTASRMDVIADRLSLEFPSRVVDKIIGGNAYRFFLERGIV